MSKRIIYSINCVNLKIISEISKNMNNIKYSKRIELFLVDGNPDGIITAEISNWNGKTIKIPRSEIRNSTREDLKKAGVYFLICKEDDSSHSVYIGEAENIQNRLLCHINDYNAGKEKYYWFEALIFIGNDLNKTSIRYLENKLVNFTKAAKRVRVLTKNTYKNTVIKESESSPLEEFLYYVKLIMNTLGYKFLEPVISQETNKQEYLFLNSKGTNAKGLITNEGFVVLKGSVISNGITQSFTKDERNKLREKLINDGTIKGFKFTKDYIFSSPSSAASIIRGTAINGLSEWKNSDGKSIKDLQKRIADSVYCE